VGIRKRKKKKQPIASLHQRGRRTGEGNRKKTKRSKFKLEKGRRSKAVKTLRRGRGGEGFYQQTDKQEKN